MSARFLRLALLGAACALLSVSCNCGGQPVVNPDLPDAGPGTACGAVNQRDNGLRAASHQADDPRVALLHIELPLRTPRSGCGKCVRAEFGSGAERAPVAPENDDPRSQAVVKSGEIGDQFVGHDRRHRIERIRPIERKNFGCVMLFDADGREFLHVLSSQVRCLAPGRQDVTVTR